jgi:hypothetical protein
VQVTLLYNEQNLTDARCLLFTQLDASEAMMMVAGQCDKNSWNFARAGLRTPLLSLRMRPDEFPCRYLPLTTTTPSTLPPTSARGWLHSGGGGEGGGGEVGANPGLSFSVTVPPGGPRDQSNSAAYEEPNASRDRSGGHYRQPGPADPRGNEPASGGATIQLSPLLHALCLPPLMHALWLVFLLAARRRCVR